MADSQRPPLILVIDDEPLTRDILVHHLGKIGCRAQTAVDGVEGLERVAAEAPDLILCDVKMPRLDGMEVVKRLKTNPDTRLIPVVMLTSLTDAETKVKALQMGADDLLTKPPQPLELRARIQNLLRMKSFTDELEHAETVLFALAEAVEAKDPYTGRHCQRLSAYSVLIGEAMGLPPEEIRALKAAGVLHDVGKVGIPDSILLKAGPLTAAEWEIMRQHPLIGERLCLPMRSMRLVAPIIRNHHERFDGGGYPDGLKGEAIPLTARILQVVDAFDALITRRPYKGPMPRKEVLELMRREGDEGKWDPVVLQHFLALLQGKLPLEDTYLEVRPSSG